MPLPAEFEIGPEGRVIRQLVEALLFENIVEPVIYETGHPPRWSWVMGKNHYRGRAWRLGFGRFRLASHQVEYLYEGNWLPATLERLLYDMPALEKAREGFSFEVIQTLRWCQWNQRHLSTTISRRQMDCMSLDAALDEGHPYHPSFKARIGFNEEDNRRFAPESAAGFKLEFLAVRRERVQQRLPVSPAQFWENELGESGWQALVNRLTVEGLDPEHYALVPLHPWQLTYLTEQGALPQGAKHLGCAGACYRPTQSLRTLYNLDWPDHANIKLPLNLVNTSSLRTLESHTVCLAPVISAWLKQVVAEDPVFACRYPLQLLGEYAGMTLDNRGDVAAIWRESPLTCLRPGEEVVPFNALMMFEKDNLPFIHPWVEEYGLKNWVKQLIAVSVLPVWHMLVHHGIGLEAHGQNMLLVHRDGWPVRLMLRDFHDSVEYVPDFVRQPELLPDFLYHCPSLAQAYANQSYWMETTEWLRELVMDTLFVFNLSEIAWLCQYHYQLPDDEFWRLTCGMLEQYADEHREFDRLKALNLYADTIYTESLLTRKLADHRVDFHHKIPNTLAQASLAGTHVA